MQDIAQHPKILLLFNPDNTLFYEYMFMNNTVLNKYKTIFNIRPGNIKTGQFKYIVR
jgi:hypothetical protein